ncbi:GNAT family N-acetyltransferase [Rhizobium grahamii]|uniref:GNAT family N-acetyltransferase n=1 Tax=Rhizobium grahamii TaxID=1120045 RepID=A0A370KH34_9HYPH|nr:GNAT family N-acetyltransferase [Rhizobium grahamii]RDJ04242.1 GNAT family N-acetyltransferase [Rhizobium grahamii]
MLQFAHKDLRSGESEPVTHVYDTIRAIGREAWNACFPGNVEDYDCLLAIEGASIGNFEWRYLTVVEDGKISAAMPAFLCPYPLDATLEEGMPRRLIRRVRQHASGFLVLRLACLGSPCTETGAIGFHADVPEERREPLFGQLLAAFEALAAADGCALMGIKDIAAPVAAEFGAVLAKCHYAAIGGLPSAWLDIDFKSIDEYMGRLSAGTRKDMRRKLKSFDAVTVAITTDIGHLLPCVMALYHDTRNRSEWQFEELTPAYFEGILTHMAGRSFCALYFVGDELLAANLIVHDDRLAIDKFFCMDGERGRPYNLYFLSWFTNLRYCLDHGLARYQSGQAYYENKVRLGSQLTTNTIFFRHRNRLVQALLRLVSPLFSQEEAK